MSNPKSAKDLAFDRERQKWQSRANALKKEIGDLKCDLVSQQAINEAQEDVISELIEENKRLRKLLDVPREELNNYLKAEREKAERENKLASLLSFGKQVYMSPYEGIEKSSTIG